MSIESPPPTPPMSINSPPPPTPPAHVDSSSFNSSIGITITMYNDKKAGSDSDGSSPPPPPPPHPKKRRVLEGRSLGVDDDGDCDMPTLGEESDDDVALSQEQEEDDDRGTSRRRIKLCLPSPLELSDEKESLLAKRGLSTHLQVPTSTDTDLATMLEGLVKASRILHLDERELYFVEDGDDGPFSTINELESLYTIWSSIECLKSDPKPEEEKVLQLLQELTSDKINALCPEYPDKETFKEEAEDGKELLKWGQDNGMTADKINITRCSETGRGVEASEDIEIGEIVLKVPGSLIINGNTDDNTVKISKKYKSLMGKDISSEELLLLWCMMERRDPRPKFKAYFKSLPPKFCTGLSFGKNAVSEMEVTYVGWELQEILEHLSKRFQKLRSEGVIPSEYDFEEYLWARQLLDTNGMRIFASGGTSRLCLVPVAGFFNHSFCPHILRHEIDHKTNSIIFRASRPCKKGEQCYISYGNLSGDDLVKSYGFLPLGCNRNDVLTIDLGRLVDDIDTIQRNDGFKWPTAMLRTIPWFKSMILPTRFLHDLSTSVAQASGDMSQDIIKSSVREALENLQHFLLDIGIVMQDEWGSVDESDSSDELPLIQQSDGIDVDNEILTKPYHRKREIEWDVKLVRDYKYRISRLAISAHEACKLTLKKNDSMIRV